MSKYSSNFLNMYLIVILQLNSRNILKLSFKGICALLVVFFFLIEKVMPVYKIEIYRMRATITSSGFETALEY